MSNDTVVPVYISSLRVLYTVNYFITVFAPEIALQILFDNNQ